MENFNFEKALGTDVTLKPRWNVPENSGPPAFAWRIPGLKSETWGTHHLIQEVLMVFSRTVKLIFVDPLL